MARITRPRSLAVTSLPPDRDRFAPPLFRLTPGLLAAMAVAAFAAAGTAHAQKVRPGLWEGTFSMKTPGAPEMQAQMDAHRARIQEQLARMPPEQRAQMEAMLNRAGMGTSPDNSQAARTCITPEMAARNQMPTADARCKSTGYSRTGNTVRFKFVCEGANRTEGEGEFTLVSDTETKGKMSSTVQRQGQTMRVDMETSSKWIGADCGNVKPAPTQ
jgi:hypothetical protein